MSAVPETLSPELVLVSPDLADGARAALTDRPWEAFLPPHRAASRSPRPDRRGMSRPSSVVPAPGAAVAAHVAWTARVTSRRRPTPGRLRRPRAEERPACDRPRAPRPGRRPRAQHPAGRRRPHLRQGRARGPGDRIGAASRRGGEAEVGDAAGGHARPRPRSPTPAPALAAHRRRQRKRRAVPSSRHRAAVDAGRREARDAQAVRGDRAARAAPGGYVFGSELRLFVAVGRDVDRLVPGGDAVRLERHDRADPDLEGRHVRCPANVSTSAGAERSLGSPDASRRRGRSAATSPPRAPVAIACDGTPPSSADRARAVAAAPVPSRPRASRRRPRARPRSRREASGASGAARATGASPRGSAARTTVRWRAATARRRAAPRYERHRAAARERLERTASSHADTSQRLARTVAPARAPCADASPEFETACPSR